MSRHRHNIRFALILLIVVVFGVTFGNKVVAQNLPPGLVYSTDFENVTKQDANHLNLGINHEFDLTEPGGAMWVEGLDRHTPGVSCHSGSYCIGMEMTNITQSKRNEFNVLHLENLVGDELFVSVWLYLPQDWTLHNFYSPSHNWDQPINPFFTDGPSFLPYASVDIIQPDITLPSSFDLRLDYRDINSNQMTLQSMPNYPLPRGTWFNVQYYVYRSVSNGIIKVWINGALTFNAANVSTENPSIASWFTTPAKIYYDPADNFSPYRTWLDDLQIYNSLPQSFTTVSQTASSTQPSIAQTVTVTQSQAPVTVTNSVTVTPSVTQTQSSTQSPQTQTQTVTVTQPQAYTTITNSVTVIQAVTQTQTVTQAFAGTSSVSSSMGSSSVNVSSTSSTVTTSSTSSTSQQTTSTSTTTSTTKTTASVSHSFRRAFFLIQPLDAWWVTMFLLLTGAWFAVRLPHYWTGGLAISSKLTKLGRATSKL